MKLYDLNLTVEEIADGGDYHYLATSPDLPNLIVAGDTAEEVLSLAPHIAASLIASMKAASDPLPPTLKVIPSLPFKSHVAVAG